MKWPCSANCSTANLQMVCSRYATEFSVCFSLYLSFMSLFCLVDSTSMCSVSEPLKKNRAFLRSFGESAICLRNLIAFVRFFIFFYDMIGFKTQKVLSFCLQCSTVASPTTLGKKKTTKLTWPE